MDSRCLQLRIAALERAQRRSRWLMLASLLSVSLLVLVAAAGPRIVRGNRFQLVDSVGKTRAEWAAIEKGGSQLVFFDKKKQARLNLSVQKSGHAAVVLYDAKAKPRATFSTRDDDSPTWVLYDENGQARATLALRKDGQPILFFSDEKGKLISFLPHPGSR